MEVAFLYLTLYGFGHLLIETVSASIFFVYLTNSNFVISSNSFYYILYICFSFASQSVIGLIVDIFNTPRSTCLLGIASIFIALLLFSSNPLVALVLAAAGNALFHVGGGGLSLRLTPNKAFGPGLFVAPGAIGLLFGTLIGKSSIFPTIFFQLALASLFVTLLLFSPNLKSDHIPTRHPNYFTFSIIFLLVSICIRGTIGLSLPFAWKSQTHLLFLLTGFIFLGKALGGLLADKYGWTRVSILALILSAPLNFLGINYPSLGLAGAFLFNITMSVTITAVANLLPNRPAFSFGLGSLALAIGALPVYLNFPLLPVWVLTILTLISASLLLFSLTHLNKY
jgi:MFS transporter, FSR family, fosmidomycin resistance protein